MNSIADQMDAPKSRARILRILLAGAITLIGILAFTLVTRRTDYIEYWSSGKLLLQRVNPYSPAGVFALEKTQGYSHSRALIMLNPPWTLFLVAPLGLTGLRVGLFLWTLATTACVVISAYLLNVPSKDRAFAYVFAPAVAAVFMGQSSTFLLLGFALFLRFYRSHPFFAGASLLLMAFKPHLFLVFWAVLLVDCVYRRRFLIVAGGACALIATSAFAMGFDPNVWRHYFEVMRGYKLQQSFLPTASMLFRLLIDVRAFWLLFVPSAVAICWGIWYYMRRKQEWDWRTHGMLLMIVTILASPYGWMTDEAVLLPSILFALTLSEKRRYSAWILLTINTAILIIALGRQASLASLAYIWTPVTWLAWFLYATWRSKYAEQISIRTPDQEAIGEVSS